MKNIHLLPTEKPSRLFYNKKDSIFTIDNDFENVIEEDWFQDYNIYITSDEEIKDVRTHNGKWQLEKGQILNKFPDYLTDLSECKLVILTTDQDLITDGVQAIDDEFLEWFVKNPSCEFVGIKSKKIRVDKNFNDISHWNRFKYEIIISKEDSKQEGYICPHTKIQCDDECCVSAEDCHITFSLASGMVDCDEPKQETLNKIKIMENNRQTGKSSRIADFITDQLFSFGRCISTDHIAYEFDNVKQEQLSYFVEKVKSRVETHSHGSKKIEYKFIKINGINMIDFKMLDKKIVE